MLWGYVIYVGRGCEVQVWGMLLVFSVEDVELPPSLETETYPLQKGVLEDIISLGRL